jgi:hypothetical protein
MHGFLSRAKLLPKAYDAIADIAAVLNARHEEQNGARTR